MPCAVHAEPVRLGSQDGSNERTIYKFMEIDDDGYARLKLSDRPPRSGTYEIVSR